MNRNALAAVLDIVVVVVVGNVFVGEDVFVGDDVVVTVVVWVSVVDAAVVVAEVVTVELLPAPSLPGFTEMVTPIAPTAMIIIATKTNGVILFWSVLSL